MSFNPYEAPSREVDSGLAPEARGRFVQAAIVAWLAAAFWAVVTGLITLGVVFGGASGVALILPVALIGFYAFRGYQVFKGEVAAATALLWLHAVGGAVAAFQMAGGAGTLVTTLNGVKLAIHVLGCITALRARSAPAQL